MLSCFSVTIPLRQAKINHVNLRLFAVNAHKEIVGLHVAMKEVLGVHEFNPCYHLFSEHADCLKRETTVAELEKIFQRRAEQLHYHGFIVTLNTVPVDVRDAGTTLQESVELVFIFELRELGLNRLLKLLVTQISLTSLIATDSFVVKFFPKFN